MSATITLRCGENCVTLPAPSEVQLARLRRRQALGRCAGGTLYVYDKGVAACEVELRLAGLHDGEKEALTEFFAAAAAGALHSFTYTDVSGNDFTARFLEPVLTWEKSPAGAWSVRFILELDAMAK